MLLENSGIIPQLASDPAQQPKRRRIIKESVYITLLAWAIALASVLLWDVGRPFETVAKFATLVFLLVGLVGLLRFLYAFLFVKAAVQIPAQTTLPGAFQSGNITEGSTRAILPAPRSVPVSDYSPGNYSPGDYSPRGKTRELVSQPSVTENTTRLLEDPDK